MKDYNDFTPGVYFIHSDTSILKKFCNSQDLDGAISIEVLCYICVKIQ